MNIVKKLEDKKLTICVDGRLDTSTAPELDEELKASLGGGSLLFPLPAAAANAFAISCG